VRPLRIAQEPRESCNDSHGSGPVSRLRGSRFPGEVASVTQETGSAPVGQADSLEFEDVLRAVYCGVHDTPPWGGFLRILQRVLNLSTVTLVLRQPRHSNKGVLISVGTNENLENRYRSKNYHDDPFLGIRPGGVFTLPDVIAREDLEQTQFYRELMSSGNADIEHFMAADIDVPMHGLAKLRMSRRRGIAPFSLLEKSLCARLLPHLSEAIGHYARAAVSKVERSVQSLALDQLSVGAIILDESDRVLCVNDVARLMLEGSRHIRIVDERIRVSGGVRNEASPRFAQAMQRVRQAWLDGEHGEIGVLRLETDEPQHWLQILIRPFALPQYHYNELDVGLALFVGDGVRRHQLSRHVVSQLFGFSRAESLLVLKLCLGLTVVECAEQLGISINTARSQLRSVYEKAGVQRLSELTSLVLHSTANLG